MWCYILNIEKIETIKHFSEPRLRDFSEDFTQRKVKKKYW